ncbi:GNAT family N-acetyltransferase [Lutibacter sp. TH_r2]|uniref:GNAT family N-acetyltransferase n=1 Tax=Lutibacter sp. TH_r2 TaxID=3082083 RepID=UPI002955E000|nr:GNAT family N-acetyltransferase [Lutibacter sp. TH_r2]MDV7187626.1 GNAT family N-acetyltransferase [Lutibacter sp. TH_r2]
MLSLNFNPTFSHIETIEKWLLEEVKNTGEGFYNNWSTISKAFDEQNLIVIFKNEDPIGFLVYNLDNNFSIIDIISIKPDIRGQGIARFFIKEVLLFFKSKGALVTTLFCSPEKSKHFWEKVGFSFFSEVLNDNKISMYKELVETPKTTKSKNIKAIIKLWDCEPYQARSKEPYKVWNIEFEEDNKTFKTPLIFPVSIDWQIVLIKSESDIITNKIKYLDGDITYSNNVVIIKSFENI